MTFEKSFAIKETEVVQAGYLNLGWDNGRMQNTIEQANCYSLGHNKLGKEKCSMFKVTSEAQKYSRFATCVNGFLTMTAPIKKETETH